MVRAGASKPFLADAIEWEAYPQTNTAWDIYKLQGETPEIVLSGDQISVNYVSSASMNG